MKFKVDFYRPKTTSIPEVPFENILKSVASIPEGLDRVATINNCPVFLKRIEKVGDRWMGDFVRLKVDEPAIKGNVGGKLSTVPLNKGEALSAMTAFLYEPKSRFFCLERNRNGLGPGAVTKHFSTKGKFDGILTLEVVIAPDALVKIKKMAAYRSLDFSLATVDDLSVLQESVPSVSGAIATAKLFDAPRLVLKVSMGHERGGLSKRVWDTIGELLKRRNENKKNVGYVKVFGRDPETDKIEPVDLIQNRVIHGDEVKLSHDENVWYSERREALIRAWECNQVELRRFYNNR